MLDKCAFWQDFFVRGSAVGVWREVLRDFLPLQIPVVGNASVIIKVGFLSSGLARRALVSAAMLRI